MDTNFELAPPAKVVDGLNAVPIDTQRIAATLSFDGVTQQSTGDATIEFVTGIAAGNPIFDLRQTISAAWLDGTSIPPEKLAHHDFGGGAHAALRVVESALLPGTMHTLRVVYSLGPPQASTAGSYQPGLIWNAGPRLAFNFGFTDLGGGRYLEAWVPANLIFDQYEIELTLEVLGTAIAHRVITNGMVTALGTNRWRVDFPKHFSACSPLLELRAADALATLTDTVMMPVSGSPLTIEAWKLASGAANLATAVASLKTWLPANESAIGRYLHGNRFVAFLHTGGMEYEGGTTTGTSALQHETYHSWWARGLKPASQPDAWWDEAWTQHNVDTPPRAVPFDFTLPAVELASRNPWVRATAPGSYAAGDRFFEGLAALVGSVNLRQWMSDFYNAHDRKPVRTTEIEEFLLCRSGNPTVVDAFHRFVYGFAEPVATPDLWLKDDAADAGAEPFGGMFWDSPDLWVRNADDGGLAHQNPEYGQDNWFYARVRNRGATLIRHFVVAFNVKPFAGMQFQYPSDFLPCIAAASGFDLAPGATAVVKARWPKALVAPPGTHACWLAAIFTRGDQPHANRHVWEANNLAQKNLTVVDLQPNAWIIIPVVVSSLRLALTHRVELIRPRNLPDLAVSLVHPTGAPFAIGNLPGVHPIVPLPADDTSPDARDCGGGNGYVHGDTVGMLTSEHIDTRFGRHFADAVEVEFGCGATASIPLRLRPHSQTLLGLKVRAPATASRFKLHLVQGDSTSARVLGGIAVEIRIAP